MAFLFINVCISIIGIGYWARGVSAVFACTMPLSVLYEAPTNDGRISAFMLILWFSLSTEKAMSNV